MYFHEMMDEVNELVGKVLAGANALTTSEQIRGIGLDPRAASTIWICDDFIAIRRRNQGTMNYYGGFEYVDADCVDVLGDFVFYNAENSRVAGHIERHNDAVSETEL